MNGEDKRPIDGDFNGNEGNNQGLNDSMDEKSGRGAEWRGEEENGYFSSRKSSGERWNESSSYGGGIYGSSGENLDGGNGENGGRGYYGGNGENGGRGYYGGNGENGGNGYFSAPRNGYPPQGEGIYADGSERRKGLGIAGFVLGLISVVCCCIEILPLICAILAIIFCVLRLKVKNDGLAIAGLVLGIIGSLFGLFSVIILSSGVMNEFDSMYSDMFEEIYGAILKFAKNFPKKF